MSCRVDAGSSVADENKLKDMCGEENKEENKRRNLAGLMLVPV